MVLAPDGIVRLGVRPSSGGLAGAGYRRILQGQTLHLHTISDAAVTFRAWARVIYDDGSGQILTVPETVRSASRVAQDIGSTDVVIQNGWVVNAEVEMLTADIQRGQAYVRLAVEPFGCVLLQDYCFSDFGNVSLGTYIQPGPRGGDGHLEIVTVKAEGAPAAVTIHALAISNSIRKIYNWQWYYECSADVASRVLVVEYRNMLGPATAGMSTGPTGMWFSSTLTLTGNEDGGIWANHAGSGINDASVESLDSSATKPSPLPFLIRGGDPGTFTFIVTLGEVLDLDVIYMLQETWVIPVA